MTTNGGRFECDSDPSGRVGTGISVVLIDRRPLTRECLSQLLRSPSLRVVSVESPVDLLDSGRMVETPQLILLSIEAASVNDPEVRCKIALLQRHMAHIPLVLLSHRNDVDDIVAAIEIGVRGYIPTSLEVSEVAAALHCVEFGGTFVPASALIKFARDRQHDFPRCPRDLDKKQFKGLTRRESEVLALLRQGKPNKIIAHELDISESTVKVFVGRILKKLHASNRTEAACLGMVGRSTKKRSRDGAAHRARRDSESSQASSPEG